MSCTRFPLITPAYGRGSSRRVFRVPALAFGGIICTIASALLLPGCDYPNRFTVENRRTDEIYVSADGYDFGRQKPCSEASHFVIAGSPLNQAYFEITDRRRAVVFSGPVKAASNEARLTLPGECTEIEIIRKEENNPKP